MKKKQFNIASALIDWAEIKPEALAIAIPKKKQHR